MKFTGTFVSAKLDLRKYEKELEAHLWQELKLAAGAWLAATEGRVPVWSGMAKASLLELSELIDGTIVISPLRAKSRIPQGKPLGTAVPEISPTGAKITITTDVEHYNIQEFRRVPTGGSPSAPWRSLQAGAAAFRQAADLVTLPIPGLKPIRIKV